MNKERYEILLMSEEGVAIVDKKTNKVYYGEFDLINRLQERIDNATERLNTLIEFWKKYNPIDNTMQVEQFKSVINILGGKE